MGPVQPRREFSFRELFLAVPAENAWAQRSQALRRGGSRRVPPAGSNWAVGSFLASAFLVAIFHVSLSLFLGDDWK